MNYSDSERFAAVLEDLGYKRTQEMKQSDVIVINSCSVRQRAEDRVIGLNKKIRQLKKLNPRLKVILTGCMTKRENRLEPDPIKREMKEEKENNRLKKTVPWVDIILNVEDLSLLPKLLGGEEIELKNYFSIEPVYSSSFQAYVPISTGCNNFCSYCIVPFTRGAERSRAMTDILREVKGLIERGYKEITLLGQNVNSYGNDLGEQNLFPKLLSEINEFNGEFWIQFVSSHPKDISHGLINVIAQGKHLAPQIHFAMQSGNDNVLKRMNRHYTVKHYLELVDKIKNTIPDIAVTTDIIVGFPGETESEFQDTKNAMKSAEFSMAYLNEYSPRKGTKSAEMIDNVPSKTKRKRKEELNDILTETSLKFNKRFLSKKVIVLLTNTNEKGTIGHIAQGVDVRIPEKCHHLIGQFAEVQITEIDSWGMIGELVK